MRKYLIFLCLPVLFGCSEISKEDASRIKFLAIRTSHIDNDLELILSSSYLEAKDYLESQRDTEYFRPVVQNGDTLGKVFLNTYWFKVNSNILLEIYKQSNGLDEFSKTKLGIPIVFKKSDNSEIRKIIISEKEMGEYIDKLTVILSDFERRDLVTKFLLETVELREFKN